MNEEMKKLFEEYIRKNMTIKVKKDYGWHEGDTKLVVSLEINDDVISSDHIYLK